MSLQVKAIAEPGGVARVLLLGAGTIEHMAEAMDALRENVMSKSQVVIDLGGIQSADMTLMQAICSAHKSAIRNASALAIENIPHPVQRAAESLGFMHNLCGERDSEPCLWEARKGK